MTEAGTRILNRRVVVTHLPTETVVEIDNTDIPVDAPPRSHRQQRDVALKMLSEKVGTECLRAQCGFEFLII